MTAKTGGPAFPVQHYVNVDGETFMSEPTGMTLLDYFAGQALTGALAAYNGADVAFPKPHNTAQQAYDYAAAMLAERARRMK